MNTPRTVFGRYELVDQLGQGGFATVYRAWDPGLGREVALKALLPHLTADTDLRRRFLAEGQALASLRHPNIVPVYDVGEAEGRPFFTMELIPGQTLAAVASGPLPPAQVTAWLENLASALDYLHGAGLVHRDIKPANVLIEPGGRLVLMDLGIARAIDQTKYTATGASLGTPAYMAPEQVRGEPAGPAVDIYALGILAYQLYAARLPFVGDTAYVLHAQAYEPPPPLEQVHPGLPPGVYAAVGAALAKDANLRPASAGYFAEILRGEASFVAPASAVGTYMPPASTSGAGSALSSAYRGNVRRPLPLLFALAGAAVALVAALGVGAVLALRGHTDQPATTVATANAAVTVVAGVPGAQQKAPAATVPAPARTAAPAQSQPSTPVATVAVPQASATLPATPPAAPLAVSNFQVRSADQWALGRAELQGCFSYQNAAPTTTLRVRIARADNPGTPLADGPALALAAASGELCGIVPPSGAVAAGNYVALLYDSAWQEQKSYSFNVQPPVTIAPPPPATVQATQPPVPPAPAATAARNTIGRYALVTSPDGVNVHAQPGDSTRLGCLAGGARVEIAQGPSNAGAVDWYYVRDYGWITSEFLQPGPPPTTSTGSPADAARGFYEALDRRDFAAAWAAESTASHARQNNSYNAWMHGYDTTRAVVVNKITSSTTRVTVDYVYTDAAASGLTANRRLTTWSVVQEAGNWRLDAVISNSEFPVCG